MARRARALQEQGGPVASRIVGAAGKPALLPGLAGLLVEPVQQPVKAAAADRVPAALAVRTIVRADEQAVKPLHQLTSALAGLPPGRGKRPGLPTSRPFPSQPSPGIRVLAGVHAAVLERHAHAHPFPPPSTDGPSRACSTSGR